MLLHKGRAGAPFHGIASPEKVDVNTPSPKSSPTGFSYRTVAFTWVKTRAGRGTFPIGLGYWTRANPEQCLLATRGRPKRIARNVPQLIISPRREHSRKPDEVRTYIEHLIAGPYCELFARSRAPGWDAFGDEAGLFDSRGNAARIQPRRAQWAVRSPRNQAVKEI